jgi:hypothetical protein
MINDRLLRGVWLSPSVRGNGAVSGRAMLGLDKTLLACSAALFFFAIGAQAQTTAFTFQGRLNDNSTAANGSYDMQFTLYDAAAPGTGTPIGAVISSPAVPVAGGVFSVQLDFGASAFPGADRFLEVGVKPAGSADPFNILTPRQPITPTPYALNAANAVTATTATNATFATNAMNATNATNFNVSGTSTIGGTLTAGTGIGVGTIAPLAPLDVRGDVFIGLTSAPPGPQGQNALFIANDGGDTHNSFRLDGYADTLQIIGHSDPGAALGTNILFRTASAGFGELDRVVINSLGNVGIGTDSPTAKLQVNGNVSVFGEVKLGGASQYYASGGEEDLRIIRGRIEEDVITGDPKITHGTGFTVSKSNFGVFYITFNTPFSDTPAVTVTPDREGRSTVLAAELDANCGCDTKQEIKIVIIDVSNSNGIDYPFDFIAIGPR